MYYIANKSQQIQYGGGLDICTHKLKHQVLLYLYNSSTFQIDNKNHQNMTFFNNDKTTNTN